jgi:hypothetical protein
VTSLWPRDDDQAENLLRGRGVFAIVCALAEVQRLHRSVHFHLERAVAVGKDNSEHRAFTTSLVGVLRATSGAGSLSSRATRRPPRLNKQILARGAVSRTHFNYSGIKQSIFLSKLFDRGFRVFRSLKTKTPLARGTVLFNCRFRARMFI